jgi:hypothetical protein
LGFATIPGASATANKFGMGFLVFPYYAQATNRKSCIGFYSGIDTESTTRPNWETGVNGGNWRSNAAITQLTFIPGDGSFAAGTRVTLYGLGV